MIYCGLNWVVSCEVVCMLSIILSEFMVKSRLYCWVLSLWVIWNRNGEVER